MKHKLLEKISPHKAPTGDLPVEYIITTSHEVVEGSKILFVSFWSDANRIKAKYKLFIDSSKEQYSTQILLDDGGYKWSGACLYNIIDYGWRHIVTGCDMSEDIIRIEDYLDCGTIANGEEIYKALRNYQQNIMDKKLKTRHKHITDKIDAVMDKVPALPDNFEQWVYNVPFDHSRYIYYKRNGKNITCFCTECKEEFIQREDNFTKKNIRHDKPGVCSKCGRKIIYKATGRAKRVCDYMEFGIIQKHEDGLLVRYFFGSKSYMHNYKKPCLHYYERLREVYRTENNKLLCDKYEYTYFRNSGKVRWCDERGKISITNICLYAENIKDVLADTPWKYSCLFELSMNTKSIHVAEFLNEFLTKPAIEYLIKLKLYNFVNDNLNRYYNKWEGVDFKAKSITGFLKIDKELFYQAQRLNLGISGIKLIKSTHKKGITLKDDQIKWVFDNDVDTGKFIDMMGLTSPHKIIRYVNEQSRPGFKAKLVLSDWCDYISQCKKLKFDLNNTFVIFPEKLQDKHEECSLMISSKGFAKYAVRVVKAYKKLNIAFGYADKNYLVRPVDSVDEIVKEGHRQRHCVASAHYVEGIACGDKAIMVIRNVDKPNEPFYTMEINLRTLSVIQCRGFRNCDMTAEVRKFVDKWKTKKLVDNGKRHTAKSA